MKTKILIAGGSGMIGTYLSDMLLKDGYEVAWLSRNIQSESKIKTYFWDTENGVMDVKALEWADGIINLAGAPVAHWPWSNSYKDEIIDSRIEPAKLIQKNLLKHNIILNFYISASASGYYGNQNDKELIESSESGSGFLSESCKLWEEAALNLQQQCRRVSIVRTGIVLSNEGGFFPKLLKPARYYLLSIPGSGKQYLPWIHIEDLCRTYLHLVKNVSSSGVFNAAAPNDITLKQFSYNLVKSINRKIILPSIPEFIIKLFLGEMAQIITDSARVQPQRLLSEEFIFKFPDINSALIDLLKK